MKREKRSCGTILGGIALAAALILGCAPPVSMPPTPQPMAPEAARPIRTPSPQKMERVKVQVPARAATTLASVSSPFRKGRGKGDGFILSRSTGFLRERLVAAA
ncbi:MAG: hypothetical protein HYX88_00205 [Chloroflexi bacterium]|nr:hypothetical protein [Chloroflexota bacterium]